MKRELRLGILGIVLAAFMIWAYQFVKGKNIFKKIITIQTVIDDVTGLAISSPVKINGFKIGNVNNIVLNPEDINSMLISMEVDGNIKFPKSTIASIVSGQLVGGKEVVLDFENLCSGSDCLQEGDFIKAKNIGFLESLVGEENLDNYSDGLKESVGAVMDTLNASLMDENSNSPINQSFRSLELTMDNLASTTSSINSLFRRSQAELSSTISNLATITETMATSDAQIRSMLTNMEMITKQLKDADLGSTVGNANKAIDTATGMLTDVSGTLEQANKTFSNLNDLLLKVDKGDGSMAKLMNDKELYENLAATSKNMSLLLQDLRLNPKRYVNVSVFGKKAKGYTVPKNDPAYRNEELEN